MLTNSNFSQPSTSLKKRTEDVLVPQQHSVVDLSLSEPGLLVSGGEDFDSNTLSLPLTPPHLTISALTWWVKTEEKWQF